MSHASCSFIYVLFQLRSLEETRTIWQDFSFCASPIGERLRRRFLTMYSLCH